MKVLQLCHKMPFPLRDGGAYSLYHTASGLVNQGIDCKVFAIRTPKDGFDASCIPSGFREVTRFEFTRVDTRVKFLHALVNLFSSHSYFVERFISEEYRADLIRILKHEPFDVIQLEHLYLCRYLETIRTHSDATVILRPQNVENAVWKRFLRFGINPLKRIYLGIAANRLRRFEMRMAGQVDGIMAISPGDAALFRKYAPATPCIEVPIGFDFGKTSSCDHNRQPENSPVFYHLGSMDWMPNVQGLTWFIKEVMPTIIRDHPEFVFRMAGKKMPSLFYRFEGKNLRIDGEVEDSEQYQSGKSVLIVPLLSGGGLRAKIVEGMSLGKTIISTTIGAEGIPYTDQENILIADSGEDFARQITRCLNSPELCREIGRNAQLLAIRNYDLNVTSAKMIRFYNSFRADPVEPA